jgi:FkbM family methyltransferase
MAHRGIVKLVRQAIILQAAGYLKYFGSPLSDEIRSIERALQYNQLREISLTLNVLDLGARNGPLPWLLPYRNRLRFFLAEPDPIEAERLRNEGYTVIEKIVSDTVGSREFYVTRSPGNSSVLHPSGHALNFYGPGDRFQVVKTETLPSTTIDAIEKEFGVQFDFVKLDIQGSELPVLESMNARPLAIETEVIAGELYKGQGTLWDLGQLLYRRGYMLADLSLKRIKGLPFLGDALFIPDPTRDMVIQDRQDRWEELRKILGL